MAGRREIKLSSPVGAEPAIFHWPLASFDGREGFEELRITLNFVCDDIPELKLPCQNLLQKVDPRSFDSVKEVCDRFNRAVVEIQRMWKGTSCSKKYLERHRASHGLLKHILCQCYYRAVTDPEKLNNYTPFSPEVYGETSFELVERMVSKIKWPENGLFCDLGSGVGQVVLQVAAMVPNLKMAYGVERADLPSAYAKAMDQQFRFWMAWYGKSFSDYQLVKEDFLTPRWAEFIAEADVVFANNFAFGPQVNHELKQRLQHMKEGAKIICSLSLTPMKFEITERTLTDIAAILRVEELSIQPNTQAVSWTGKDFSFYLHTVDRRMLEKYFERKVRRERQILNGGSIHSSSSSVSEDSMASHKSSKSELKGSGSEKEKTEVSSIGLPNSPAAMPNGHTDAIEVDPVPEKKKKKDKEKDKEKDLFEPSSSANGQPAHRGRGRPAKVPRLSSSSSSVPTGLAKKPSLTSSSSIKSSLKGAEDLILSEKKEKRKREKELDKSGASSSDHHHHHHKHRDSSEPSAKKLVKMPAGLEMLYNASVSSTSKSEKSREGRVDAFLARLRVQIMSFLDNYSNSSTVNQQKDQLTSRLAEAQKKNQELKSKEASLAEEMNQLTNQNNALLKQKIGDVFSSTQLSQNASSNSPDKTSSSQQSSSSQIQTVNDFLDQSKRIVNKNKNLRDLISNQLQTPSSTAPTSTPTTSTTPAPASSQTVSSANAALPSSSSSSTVQVPAYPLGPFQTITGQPGPNLLPGAPRPPGSVGLTGEQSMSIFNQTLAAFLPFFSQQQQAQNTGAPGAPPQQMTPVNPQMLLQQYMAAQASNNVDAMRQITAQMMMIPGMVTGMPPGPNHMLPPWGFPMGHPMAPGLVPGGPPGMVPQMGPMPGPHSSSTPQQSLSNTQTTASTSQTTSTTVTTTTSSTTSSSGLTGFHNVPASVEDALKAIMAQATTTDRTKKQAKFEKAQQAAAQQQQLQQAATPGSHYNDSSNQGTSTPDVSGPTKKTPQRRSPNKARKQLGTPNESPSRLPGEVPVSASPTPTSHPVPLSSADMADFLSHLRLPTSTKPATSQPPPTSSTPTTTSASVEPRTSTPSVAAPPSSSPSATHATLAPVSSSGSAKSSAPVLHISSMIFRPSGPPPPSAVPVAIPPVSAATPPTQQPNEQSNGSNHGPITENSSAPRPRSTTAPTPPTSEPALQQPSVA